MITNEKLENGVISTLIANDSVLIEFQQDITPSLFYYPLNQIVVQAILDLKDKSIVADHDSLELKLQKAPEEVDVYEYTNPLNVANFSQYINQLKELSYKRELKSMAVKMTSHADSPATDVFELDAELNKAATKLTNIITNQESEDNVTLMRKVISEIESAKQNKGITGTLTGFTGIDAKTGGYQAGDLIILAARPSMGKTALAIAEAMNASIDYEKNILFFSLEMSSTQLMKRQFSLVTEIPLQDFSNDHSLDFVKLNNGIARLDESFKIFDKIFSLYDIKAQCRKEHNLKPLDAIYIDYLQLIKHNAGKGRNKENEVSEVSRDLKLLAKELNVPIICLSQLSRAVENRGGAKIPQLSDLRDSGSIEQDADIVQFLYRPEYYGLTEDEEGNSTVGKALLIFAKNRNGSIGKVKLRFRAELTKFESYYEDPPKLEPPSGNIEPNKFDWLDD
jgi:replicative DNA helicase